MRVQRFLQSLEPQQHQLREGISESSSPSSLSSPIKAAEASTPPVEAVPSAPLLGGSVSTGPGNSPGEPPLLPPGEPSSLGHTTASPAGDVSVLGQSALRRWSRAHGQWQQQVSELQTACGAAVEAVRESALWHCEVVAGPSWELTHSKAYFDNLHRCGGYKCGGEGGHRRGIGGLA